MDKKAKRLAYLAGLIDGDGSFGIRYHELSGYQLTLSVYNTHRPLMNFLVQQFGGSFRKLTTIGNRKQKYQWYTSSKDIVNQVYPYLFIKKEQGNMAIQFLNISVINPELRKCIMEEIQNLNQNYVPVTKLKINSLTYTPSKSDFAYLAGIMDAEGSFSIHKRNYKGNGKYTSVARLSNTDQRVFPWLLERFGGYMLVNEKTNGNRNEGVWNMSNKNDKEKQILAMMPYLVVKKERAILYLEWIRNCRKMTDEQKHQIYSRISELNARGLSPETICQVQI